MTSKNMLEREDSFETFPSEDKNWVFIPSPNEFADRDSTGLPLLNPSFLSLPGFALDTRFHHPRSFACRWDRHLEYTNRIMAWVDSLPEDTSTFEQANEDHQLLTTSRLQASDLQNEQKKARVKLPNPSGSRYLLNQPTSKSSVYDIGTLLELGQRSKVKPTMLDSLNNVGKVSNHNDSSGQEHGRQRTILSDYSRMGHTTTHLEDGAFSSGTAQSARPDRQPDLPTQKLPNIGIQSKPGFNRWFQEHASPPHNRVTAGGRIVPNGPHSPPPFTPRSLNSALISNNTTQYLMYSMDSVLRSMEQNQREEQLEAAHGAVDVSAEGQNPKPVPASVAREQHSVRIPLGSSTNDNTAASHAHTAVQQLPVAYTNGHEHAHGKTRCYSLPRPVLSDGKPWQGIQTSEYGYLRFPPNSILFDILAGGGAVICTNSMMYNAKLRRGKTELLPFIEHNRHVTLNEYKYKHPIPQGILAHGLPQIAAVNEHQARFSASHGVGYYFAEDGAFPSCPSNNDFNSHRSTQICIPPMPPHPVMYPTDQPYGSYARKPQAPTQTYAEVLQSQMSTLQAKLDGTEKTLAILHHSMDPSERSKLIEHRRSLISQLDSMRLQQQQVEGSRQIASQQPTYPADSYGRQERANGVRPFHSETQASTQTIHGQFDQLPQTKAGQFLPIHYSPQDARSQTNRRNSNDKENHPSDDGSPSPHPKVLRVRSSQFSPTAATFVPLAMPPQHPSIRSQSQAAAEPKTKEYAAVIPMSVPISRPNLAPQTPVTLQTKTEDNPYIVRIHQQDIDYVRRRGFNEIIGKRYCETKEEFTEAIEAARRHALMFGCAGGSSKDPEKDAELDIRWAMRNEEPICLVSLRKDGLVCPSQAPWDWSTSFLNDLRPQPFEFDFGDPKDPSQVTEGLSEVKSSPNGRSDISNKSNKAEPGLLAKPKEFFQEDGVNMESAKAGSANPKTRASGSKSSDRQTYKSSIGQASTEKEKGTKSSSRLHQAFVEDAHDDVSTSESPAKLATPKAKGELTEEEYPSHLASEELKFRVHRMTFKEQKGRLDQLKNRPAISLTVAEHIEVSLLSETIEGKIPWFDQDKRCISPRLERVGDVFCLKASKYPYPEATEEGWLAAHAYEELTLWNWHDLAERWYLTMIKYPQYVSDKEPSNHFGRVEFEHEQQIRHFSQTQDVGKANIEIAGKENWDGNTRGYGDGDRPNLYSYFRIADLKSPKAQKTTSSAITSELQAQGYLAPTMGAIGSLASTNTTVNAYGSLQSTPTYNTKPANPQTRFNDSLRFRAYP